MDELLPSLGESPGWIFGTAGPVSDDQAAKYAGRRTLVHVVVEEVRDVGGTTYANFGGEYPFQTFAAVISPIYPKVFRSIPKPDEGRRLRGVPMRTAASGSIGSQVASSLSRAAL
jgi:hypothetical protein